MPVIEIAVVMFTVMHSILKTAKTISEYYENRDKETQKIIALACEYTYVTYIRKVKNGKLTDEQRVKAMEITKKFFLNKYPYKISDIKLSIYINERLLFVKQCKKNINSDLTFTRSSLFDRKNSNNSSNLEV